MFEQDSAAQEYRSTLANRPPSTLHYTERGEREEEERRSEREGVPAQTDLQITAALNVCRYIENVVLCWNNNYPYRNVIECVVCRGHCSLRTAVGLFVGGSVANCLCFTFGNLTQLMSILVCL